ncbi:hypothetical protein [Pandoraea terrigena]|nr:hypothetical protein [Pandoraea terrigena]
MARDFYHVERAGHPLHVVGVITLTRPQHATGVTGWQRPRSTGFASAMQD